MLCHKSNTLPKLSVIMLEKSNTLPKLSVIMLEKSIFTILTFARSSSLDDMEISLYAINTSISYFQVYAYGW